MMSCEICGKAPNFRYVTGTGQAIAGPLDWVRSRTQHGVGYHVRCMEERYDQMRQALEAFVLATRVDPALHEAWDILLKAGVAALPPERREKRKTRP